MRAVLLSLAYKLPSIFPTKRAGADTQRCVPAPASRLENQLIVSGLLLLFVFKEEARQRGAWRNISFGMLAKKMNGEGNVE